MPTIEELIEGIRSTGERMPDRFVRAGLIHVRDDHAWDAPVYYFEPAHDFEVDGIVYSFARRGRTAGCMLDAIDADSRCGPHRMNWANPPTEEELDLWVHPLTLSPPYIYDPSEYLRERNHSGFTNG